MCEERRILEKLNMHGIIHVSVLYHTPYTHLYTAHSGRATGIQGSSERDGKVVAASV